MKIPFHKLRAPEGADGGTGGGGAGSGDGSTTVTREELSNVVNAAVAAHVGRAVKKAATEMIPTIVEQVSAALKPSDPPGGGDGDDDDDEDDEPGKKKDPELVAMKRRQTQLENQLKAEKEARERAERTSRDDKLRSAVVDALGAHEITGDRQSAAIAALYHNGRVRVADDGAHLFVDTNGEELPLADGLKSWATSDSAKLYLPPREVKGSGDSGGGKPAKLQTKDDDLNKAYLDAVDGVAEHLL